MRIVCISDTHSKHRNLSLPDGDLLIHAGDATNLGTTDEVIAFSNWWSSLPYKHKVFVAGNHDFLWQNRPQIAKAFLQNLQDSSIQIDGLKIWGSSWTPEFMNWAFMRQRGVEINEQWDLIPDDTDILITHGPPFGVLDELPSGLRVGCRDLKDAVERVRPKLHIFGHIHHCYGQVELGNTKFINAAICDEAYRATNAPVVIDL